MANKVDLNSIETNINSGHYSDVGQFDGDMNAVFSAVLKEHGRFSNLGSLAMTLKKVCVIFITLILRLLYCALIVKMFQLFASICTQN